MPGTTLLDFAKRMEKRADVLNDLGNKKTIRAAIVGLEYLVRNTPVDTSTALSNWQVRLGDRVIASIPPYVPGLSGSTRAVSIQEALAVGTRILNAKKPGQVVYISNVLPYIRKLADGSSAQAPRGWVDGAYILMRRELAGKNV